MDIEQASKTIQWLDDERRKDKQDITSLQERLAAVTADNVNLTRRLQQLENDLQALNSSAQKTMKVDMLLEGYRKEMVRQVEELDRRRAEADKEAERLRKIERDASNKSLAELRKVIDGVPKLERESAGRKDEEARVARLIAELQLRVGEFNKHVDERNRAVTVLDEGRRQDVKRIVDLQTEAVDLRKRIDDSRSKVEMLEDMARRTDARLADVFTAENERKAAQAQWLEAQAVIQTERDRAWAELKANTEKSLHDVEDYARRVDQYSDAFREIRRVVDEARRLVELVEQRVTESTEVHRLAEERFRQDWASFLADDQKRWTTHMLLRDEQWREHDRLAGQHEEHMGELEEQLGELAATVRQMRAVDSTRMQALLTVIHELAAEYDASYMKVR
jgi:chromosome segregation ATPase